MSPRDQQNERGTTPIDKRLLRRRMNRRTIMGVGAAGAAGFALGGPLARVGAATTNGTAFSAPARLAQTADEGIRGGRLRVATTGQPAGLDGHLVGQRTITLIGWNMFEALFTFDADYTTVPMLAEGTEVSDDGLANRIT
jgi:hypothetical protein